MNRIYAQPLLQSLSNALCLNGAIGLSLPGSTDTRVVEQTEKGPERQADSSVAEGQVSTVGQISAESPAQPCPEHP